MNSPDTPLVPISWGELFDKITILEIKLEKLKNDSSLLNIRNELKYLYSVTDNGKNSETVSEQIIALKKINLELWNVEDLIREKDSQNSFDHEFIALAKSVYRLNDTRALLKRSINLTLKSELMEEKSYIYHYHKTSI